VNDARPVALVTGASRGIGAACARALAAEGFQVALHCRSGLEAAEKLAAELPDAFVLQADLAAPAEIDALIAALGERTKRVDVLVNNAGAAHDGLLVRQSLADWEATAALARGAWYLSKLVVRRFMLRAGRGRIVNVSSVVGHTGNAGQTAYAMAKAGLDALTKSLAAEFAGRDILVNSVAPGFIDTDMTAALRDDVRAALTSRIPLARMGHPEEVADVVAFLATRASYVHGSVVHVNGGLYGG
jgi:3-oxoacyl-[acyl-carrier protein] reductase